MAETLTREQARVAYMASGLQSRPLDLQRLRALRDTINREMLSAALMDGTFHMAHPSFIRINGPRVAELRCLSYYFDDREAITFNPDGFVGFAGWADNQNVQPILRGFMAWVESESATPEASQ